MIHIEYKNKVNTHIGYYIKNPEDLERRYHQWKDYEHIVDIGEITFSSLLSRYTIKVNNVKKYVPMLFCKTSYDMATNEVIAEICDYDIDVNDLCPNIGIYKISIHNDIPYKDKLYRKDTNSYHRIKDFEDRINFINKFF